ncbi:MULTISPECIES: hypothetical protein [unclassified Halomonas]|uniref:hypothetical protein n=1 Tax=unclassified Halomonas TaxID=2609666 RepID=UPI004033B5C9
MYTDEDLYQAVKSGIFEESAVEEFRELISNQANTKSVDEENFRLISGFNDIFVSVSAFILMISAGWISSQATPALGFFVVALLSWILSVFFVQKRRLALPAILLLISFVVSAVTFLTILFSALKFEEDMAVLVASGIGALAAWVHWRKFHVPITVAAGIASLVACLLALVSQVDSLREIINLFICGSGFLTFALAMRWDSKDTLRKTRNSDVAFWLHLLSAPLIVHPIFSSLGILKGESSLTSIAVVIFMYVILAAISIAVDRRALMVSSLIYVLYAFRELFNSYGMVSSSLAFSGVFIGSVLLLLSAFWHRSREILLKNIPGNYVKYVPPIN